MHNICLHRIWYNAQSWWLLMHINLILYGLRNVQWGVFYGSQTYSSQTMYIDYTYVIVLIVFIKSTMLWHSKYIMFCYKINIMGTFWHGFAHFSCVTHIHIIFNLWHNVAQWYLICRLIQIPSHRVHYSTTSTEIYALTSHKNASLHSQTFLTEWFRHGQCLDIRGTILCSSFPREDSSVLKKLGVVARSLQWPTGSTRLVGLEYISSLLGFRCSWKNQQYCYKKRCNRILHQWAARFHSSTRQNEAEY